MKTLKLSLLMVAVAACSSPPPPLATPIPARVAMDSVLIERICARPAYARVGLLECELKDQAPVLPFEPFRSR